MSAPTATVAPRRGWALRLYGLAMGLLLPALLARVWWRGAAEPAYRHALAERFGFAPRRGEPGALWLHAVSLGETRAAAALVNALRERHPTLRLLLTHGTATGRAAGEALLRPGDRQVWLPWDAPGAVRRFLQAHQPAVGVLMETEVWPVLLHEAAARNVPVVLANARLSERSLKRGDRLAALMRPAVGQLVRVLAQTQADADRLVTAGARQVSVCGNLKFDMSPAEALLHQGARWRKALARPVVLAASTREGEEAPLLAAWRDALPAAPRPLLLIVPRHPQRFDEVARAASDAGLTVQRRSTWTDGPPAAALAPDVDVWIGDSIGEMPLYYAAADVGLLGGSFAPLGGQNLIEAAACGCPLLLGPSTFNFADAADLAVAAGAATRVANLPEAVACALALLSDAARRARQSADALAFAAAHRGAAARMADDILRLWPRHLSSAPPASAADVAVTLATR